MSPRAFVFFPHAARISGPSSCRVMKFGVGYWGWQKGHQAICGRSAPDSCAFRAPRPVRNGSPCFHSANPTGNPLSASGLTLNESNGGGPWQSALAVATACPEGKPLPPECSKPWPSRLGVWFTPARSPMTHQGFWLECHEGGVRSCDL